MSIPELVLTEEDQTAGIDGVMRFAVTIDEAGTVKDAKLQAGPAWPCGTNPVAQIEKVTAAARYRVLAARFTPSMKDGVARAADITFDFRIGRAFKDEVKQQHARTGAIAPPADAGMTFGRATSIAAPEYPESAKQAGASGLVTVWVLIDENGKVEKAGAVGGHQLLQGPARQAACAARYTPTTIQGHPVKTTGTISFNFRR
jgi:TonB family protein